MRRLMVVTPAFVLIAICGSSAAAQEQALVKRDSATLSSGDRGPSGDSVPSQ